MAIDDKAVRTADGASEGVEARGRRLPRRAGDPWLWTVCAAVFATYAVISVARYATGEPAMDLAIFTEAVKQYAHFHAPVVDLKGVGYNLLGDHFHPLLVLLVPLWWVWPSAAALLVAQAGLSAVSVIPVYRAAAHHLPRGEARIVAAAYGFSWGLAALNWYEFHEVAVAVPLIACSLSALVRGKHLPAVWWALPLVFTKEDQGFTVAAIGLAVALMHRKRAAGAFLAAWGLGWSLLEIYVLIPHFNADHVYTYWARGVTAHTLGSGMDIKLPTLLLTLLPTVFLALRSPLAAIALPSLALRLASSDWAYWSTMGHYSATVMPIVFVAAIDGLRRIRSGRPSWARGLWPWLGVHGPAMVAVVAVALAVWSPLSNLWTPGTYRTSPEIRAVHAAEQRIPRGVVVDSSITAVAGLAARDDVVYWDKRKIPAYLLFDQDAGDWNVPPTVPPAWFPGATYRVVFHREHVWLFQRTSG